MVLNSSKLYFLGYGYAKGSTRSMRIHVSSMCAFKIPLMGKWKQVIAVLNIRELMHIVRVLSDWVQTCMCGKKDTDQFFGWCGGLFKIQLSRVHFNHEAHVSEGSGVSIQSKGRTWYLNPSGKAKATSWAMLRYSILLDSQLTFTNDFIYSRVLGRFVGDSQDGWVLVFKDYIVGAHNGIWNIT